MAAVLNTKRELFCVYYAQTGNGTESAKNAGYKATSAYSIASRLLKIDEVKERIQALKDELIQRANVTKEDIINEHKKIAFANVTQALKGWLELEEFNQLDPDIKAAIQEVSYSTQTKMVKIKMYSKQVSLEALSRMYGYEKPPEETFKASDMPPVPIEYVIVNGSGPDKELTDEEADRLI